VRAGTAGEGGAAGEAAGHVPSKSALSQCVDPLARTPVRRILSDPSRDAEMFKRLLQILGIKRYFRKRK
jgi:hypothetical protein